ncbi:MAG: thiopurine S-methyltransferase [Gammaproteobacteria bacterium]|nr:thiopurine S-methyltransferase [Gammaproteobacteria bacterium]
MNPEFWQAKWRANEIGFHQNEIHPLLSAHWPANALANARVLVPLCGKSHDLVWLQERGFSVVGFELSEIAVAALFAENALSPQVTILEYFKCYATAGITIYCGDFFSATLDLCGTFDAIYDRAALIALEPAQRDVYLAAVRRLCPVGTRGLLITVEYPEGLVLPPPFSLTSTEVAKRYGEWCKVTLLAQRESDVKGKSALEKAYDFVVES